VKRIFTWVQSMNPNNNTDPGLENYFSAESACITRELLNVLREESHVSLNGIHGIKHWKRVRQNGLLLAENNAANKKVVELFAFLHDSQRLKDHGDWAHGKRAVDLINRLHGTYFTLTKDELEDLKTACAAHSEGLTKANITIQTCWDADRLDLGRVGIYPDPRKMCTEQARRKEVIEAAYLKSIR
jgi:uncharacterized protein